MKKYKKEELFNMDPVEVYKLVLQGRELRRFPSNFWKGQEGLNNAIACSKYLIEDILKLDEHMIKEQLSSKLFFNNRLGSMLQYCFAASPFKAIETIYPNRYKPWEFNIAPSHLWKDTNNGINATKWLIEEKLKLTDEQVKEQLSRDLFERNGLRGMLRHCFKDSPYLAISSAYPNRYNKCDFKNYYTRKN